MTTKWSVEMLQAARQRGDTRADAVVHDIVRQGGIEEAGKMFARIASVYDSVPPSLSKDENVSKEVLAYLEENDPPDWVNMDIVAQGQNFYVRSGLEINLILMCGSLPTCYAAAKGAEALNTSHQISKQVLRRIIETLRFLMAVMTPGSLVRGGVGALTAKKIRLLHTLNRFILLNDPEMRYNREKLDVPLNQEDLAMTLMSFSVFISDSLKKLEHPVSAEDEAAYFHTWRYIGHLMGIEDAMLPMDAADGRAQLAAIAAHQYAASDAGHELTKALVNFLEEMVPGGILDGLIPGKVRLLVGDPVADMLGVPPSDWTSSLLSLARFVHGVEKKFDHDGQIVTWFSDYFGRTVMHEIEKIIRTDGRPMFHVPDALRHEWKMPPHPQASTHAVVVDATATTPRPEATSEATETASH